MLNKLIFLFFPLSLLAQNQTLSYSKGTYQEHYRTLENVTIDGLSFDLANQKLIAINDTGGIDEYLEEGDGTRWLSLDPLAAKYPSMSPYHFSANSPILYKDPDGKKIIIYYDSGKKDSFGSPMYNSYEYGSKLELPNDEFVKKTVLALDHLSANSSSAKELIDKSIAHKKSVGIFYLAYKNTINTGQVKNTIEWAPEGATMVANVYPETSEIKYSFQSAANGLAHELDHWYFYITNKRFSKKLTKSEIELYDNKEEERVISGSEKLISEQLGEGTRNNHFAFPVFQKDPTSVPSSDIPYENSHEDKLSYLYVLTIPTPDE